MSALKGSRRNDSDFSHICLTGTSTVVSSTQVFTLKLLFPRGLFLSPSAGYTVSGLRLAGNAGHTAGNARNDASFFFNSFFYISYACSPLRYGLETFIGLEGGQETMHLETLGLETLLEMLLEMLLET